MADVLRIYQNVLLHIHLFGWINTRNYEACAVDAQLRNLSHLQKLNFFLEEIQLHQQGIDTLHELPNGLDMYAHRSLSHIQSLYFEI